MPFGFKNNYEESIDKTSFQNWIGVYKETEELIAIMAKSIETADKNKSKKDKDNK